MKKLALSFTFLLATFSFIQAQSCQPSACCAAKNQAKASISKTDLVKLVQKKYQNARVTNVAFSDGYYKTTLLASNDKKMLAYHTGKGQWQVTKVYVSKSSLPSKVRKTLKDQNQWDQLSTTYKMVYPNRPVGYVAKTNKGKRIDFDYNGKCLTNLKCTKSGKCDPSKCDDKGNCKPGSCKKAN